MSTTATSSPGKRVIQGEAIVSNGKMVLPMRDAADEMMRFAVVRGCTRGEDGVEHAMDSTATAAAETIRCRTASSSETSCDGVNWVMRHGRWVTAAWRLVAGHPERT
jgi:hypothetical protein